MDDIRCEIEKLNDRITEVSKRDTGKINAIKSDLVDIRGDISRLYEIKKYQTETIHEMKEAAYKRSAVLEDVIKFIKKDINSSKSIIFYHNLQIIALFISVAVIAFRVFFGG